MSTRDRSTRDRSTRGRSTRDRTGGRHILVVPALIAWLVVLWVGLWGDVSAANVISGLAVAIAVIAFGRRSATSPTTVTVRPWRALVFLGYCLVELVEANLVLAREIVTPRNTTHTGIIGVTVHSPSDVLVTLVANVITLTPGSVTLEVVRNGDTATVYLHVLHLHDAEAVRADARRLERLAIRAFGGGPVTPEPVPITEGEGLS